jgi:hypothetical protein
LEQRLLFIGLDDTDTLESQGTGHLARQIAAALAADYRVLGVTRHQLLVDSRVPYTAKNSSAAILLEPNGGFAPGALMERVQAVMREHFNPGSDPGLCIAPHVPEAISAFGRRAQQDLVAQAEARALAAAHAIQLLGLGGTEDGVIGALAAVGLAATGDDGRYVMVGRARDLSGLRTVAAVLAAGIADVRTLDGRPVTEGLILTDKLRPARRGAQAVAFVERCLERVEGAGPELAEGATGGYWRPLKLD